MNLLLSRENSSVNLNEFENSDDPFPLTAKLLAFKPYPEDIDLTLEITGTNVQDNADFTVTPNDVIKIRAGKSGFGHHLDKNGGQRCRH